MDWTLYNILNNFTNCFSLLYFERQCTQTYKLWTSVLAIFLHFFFNTVNKSECTKHVVKCIECFIMECCTFINFYVYFYCLSNSDKLYKKYCYFLYNNFILMNIKLEIHRNMSMGIVGVKSTAGREVKFIDPSKTTKSESTWLGYTLCDWLTDMSRLLYYYYYSDSFYIFTHLFSYE